VPVALACSPSTGPSTGNTGGGGSSAGTTAASSAGTTTAAQTTTASTTAAATTAAGGACDASGTTPDQAYGKFSNKCKMGAKKDYLIVDPANCAQAKVGPCDCSQKQFCAYLQKENAGNSFSTNTKALQFACKPLPCACVKELGGTCDSSGSSSGGGGGGKIRVVEGNDGGDGGNGGNGGSKKVSVQESRRRAKNRQRHA